MIVVLSELKKDVESICSQPARSSLPQPQPQLRQAPKTSTTNFAPRLLTFHRRQHQLFITHIHSQHIHQFAAPKANTVPPTYAARPTVHAAPQKAATAKSPRPQISPPRSSICNHSCAKTPRITQPDTTNLITQPQISPSPKKTPPATLTSTLQRIQPKPAPPNSPPQPN